MKRDRGGFTMVELIVVTVLGLLVLAAGLQVLITNQRTYTAQNAVITGQQSARMALELLFNELRETSPRGGDILMMSSDSIRVRLMRKFSVVCETDYPDGLTLKVVNFGGREFEALDSVFVFADNDERDDDDNVWIRAQIMDVDTTETCPQAGEAASLLTFTGQEALFLADSVGLGAPARSYRQYAFGPTTLMGDPYLGRRERRPDGTWTAWVPVAGPLRANGGVEFEYRDSIGDVTSTPSDVRQIVVTIRTAPGVRSSLNTPVQDSISAWIYTRN